MGIETVYNCGQNILNKMEALKKVRTGELLAQQWSICLPGNGVGGWRYWDGVRLVVWILVWGHSSLVKVRIQLRSDRRRWPGWVPNSI